MFVLLKAERLLHSEEGKQAWQFYYNFSQTSAQFLASAPVLSTPSTENFYKIISQYAIAAAIDPMYNGMFTAAVADFGSMPISNGQMSGYLLKQVDGGYYMAYNIAAATAEKIRLLTGNQ